FRDTITLTAEQIADLVAQSDAFKRQRLQFMTLAEFEELNAHFYRNSYGAEDRPERDFHLLEARINNFNGRQGPRVGDFVIMPDETFLRFTHDWSDVGGGIQTTCPESTNQSFYFSEQGFCDYSGSLDEPLPIEALGDTLQNRQGSVW